MCVPCVPVNITYYSRATDSSSIVLASLYSTGSFQHMCSDPDTTSCPTYSIERGREGEIEKSGRERRGRVCFSFLLSEGSFEVQWDNGRVLNRSATRLSSPLLPAVSFLSLALHFSIARFPALFLAPPLSVLLSSHHYPSLFSPFLLLFLSLSLLSLPL